ncbi:MFS transporter [Sporolactobacillus terrae]|uniref:MFS transporter n=1 Tax=Sporolactobacillus terrae TaxID=269673 RepID=A0A410DB47_9BACL|nr:MFS transporter [Sporolactobacillus terrae]QAA23306.1 MFS transporter [Sporolactobacillus terrae]QAA26278.1 MFS transporter [Sporolactobacillus terrae]UAK15371.1 MFS transporter [Sporolactobacillus terrae]BBN99713.1 MFS transporter [Sporolactobacillus terrae]
MNLALKEAGVKPRLAAKRQLFSLSGVHFINDLMTTGLVPALLPLYKQAFDLNYTQAGLILFVSMLTSSVAQPVFGVLSDKYPNAWFMPMGICLCGFGLTASGFASVYWLLLLCVAVSGIGSGIFHPEAMRGAYMAAGTARGTAQAIIQVGGNFGQAAGPLVLPLFLIATGLHGLGWFAIAALAGLLLVFSVMPWYQRSLEMNKKRQKLIQGRNHVTGLILLTLVVILRSWTQIGVAGFLPFLYLHQGFTLKDGELLTFLFLAAGAVGTFIGGRVSDQISRKWLLFLSMAVTIPFAWLLPHVHGVLSIIVLFLFGFFVLSSFAVTVVYGQMMFPKNIGLVSGLMVGFGIGAGGIGATLIGWLSDQYGIYTIFGLFGILPMLAAILTLFLPSERSLTAKEA